MKTVLDDCLKTLDRTLERFPWSVPRAYADWLAQTYYYVRHSTRLLAASAARFAQDEAGSALHHRFTAHMAEEKKHELLALHDLKGIGFSIDGFPEHPITRMFYESQYFKIEHQDPLSLFGYILPLEAMSVSKGPWVRERVVESHGPGCVAFLRVHVEDDVDHLDKAFRTLETASAERRQLIELNMRQTTFGYVALLSEIRRQIDDNTR
jgi:thiaminase